MADSPSEAYLVERIVSLEQAAERRALLMASTGHDLRQPLQILQGAIEHLGKGCTGAHERFWLSAAQSQISLMALGLNDLATASQPEFEGGPIQLRPVAVGPALNSVARDLSPLALRKGLIVRVAQTSAIAVSEPKMLQTILTNLVGNAIKYTDRGGVLVGARMRLGECLIDVVDTGSGMDEANVSKLCEPFVQADSGSEGLGLGLWIVSRYCRELGYRLEVSSRRGYGSRFRVRLPLTAPKGSRSPS